MAKELKKIDNSLPVEYDENDNAVVVFNEGVHFVINGDFQITAKGEVSVLSQTAISLDCAILLLNCRMAKQIRDMKEELRLEFIEILGALPEMTPSQLEYVKETKQKAKELLHLTDADISHIKTKIKEEDDD